MGKKFLEFYKLTGSFVFGVICTLCVVAACIWYGFLAFPAPWKVIDAADPRFDPMKFEFTDYLSSGKRAQSLTCLFPVGTDKTYVDKILVDIGHAEVKKYERQNKALYHPNEYLYQKYIFREIWARFLMPTPDSYEIPTVHFSIRYDAENKVESAGFLGNVCKKELDNVQ